MKPFTNRLLYPVRPEGDDVTTQLITQPYHLPRDGGPARWHLGALLTFKATKAQTAGRLWAKELLAERGMVTPVHRHSREDEAFYILDGQVSVYVGDDVRDGTRSPQEKNSPPPHGVATPPGFER